jgi:hypothetical protein
VANDEVIVTPGDYGSPSAPLTTLLSASDPGVNIHGQDGQPRPRIFISDGGSGTIGLTLAGSGAQVRHLYIEMRPGGQRQAALALSNTQGSDIVTRNAAAQGRGCLVLGNSTLTNSVCESVVQDGKGIATYTNVGPGAPNNSVLRNVTAIASADFSGGTPFSGGTGIEAFAGNNSGEDQHITVTNSIARGSYVDIAANEGFMAAGVAIVTTDHSNYGFESAPVDGSEVVDGPGGGNQRNAPVQFAAFGDYHQRATSPTVDAGATSVANGPSDFDGDLRTVGGSTDIGADEFVPPPSAVTGSAGSLTTTSAVVNGTINPNSRATTYHFDYGTSTGYGSSTATKSGGFWRGRPTTTGWSRRARGVRPAAPIGPLRRRSGRVERAEPTALRRCRLSRSRTGCSG